jgi:hypothetical protein
MSDIPDNVNTVPAEDGSTWIEIASMGGEDEAKLLQGFLEAEGIPAQIENVKFRMEPINFGTMGDIRVYVPSEHEARAQQLLREREVAYARLDEDGETLVTDEGPAVVDENTQAENDGGANSNS